MANAELLEEPIRGAGDPSHPVAHFGRRHAFSRTRLRIEPGPQTSGFESLLLPLDISNLFADGGGNTREVLLGIGGHDGVQGVSD